MPRIQTPSHLRREYEIVYLIDQGCEDPAIDKFAHKYRDLVGEQGGKVVRLDNWGLRRLAYPIANKEKATYIYMQYLGGPALVAEMERLMRITEEIVRYQTIVLDDAVDPEARPAVSDVTKHVVLEERGDARRMERPSRATAPTPMSPPPREESDRGDRDDDRDDRGRGGYRRERNDFDGGDR